MDLKRLADAESILRRELVPDEVLDRKEFVEAIERNQDDEIAFRFGRRGWERFAKTLCECESAALLPGNARKRFAMLRDGEWVQFYE